MSRTIFLISLLFVLFLAVCTGANDSESKYHSERHAFGIAPRGRKINPN